MKVLIPSLLAPVAIILLINILIFVVVLYTISFKSKVSVVTKVVWETNFAATSQYKWKISSRLGYSIAVKIFVPFQFKKTQLHTVSCIGVHFSNGKFVPFHLSAENFGLEQSRDTM